jgi:hypothetical protein
MITQCISVGTVIRKENFMKQTMMVLLMMVILTACTKIEFDGFDPTTSVVKWVITGDKK